MASSPALQVLLEALLAACACFAALPGAGDEGAARNGGPACAALCAAVCERESAALYSQARSPPPVGISQIPSLLGFRFHAKNKVAGRIMPFSASNA